MEGKTNTATAILIDEYFAHVKAIVSPEGHVFPVEPYRLDMVKLLSLPGQSNGQEAKIITIPKD